MGKPKNRNCTISDLAENFHEWMVDDKSIGFTIGEGKKLYWYLSPSPSVFYYVYPIEASGSLGYRRALEVTHKVVIHY